MVPALLHRFHGRKAAAVAAACPSALTLGVALLHLPYPFWGDQSFTLAGAMAIDRGETLYRDFWDIRQPGSFFFYWVAGRLFGFNEFGVHALEVLWMLLAAIVFMAAARALVSRVWLVAAVPLLTVGIYYCQASDWELTQAEALLMLPISVCFWSTVSSVGTRRQRALAFFIFGFAAAMTAIFKLVVLLVPATLAAIRITVMIHEEKIRVRTVLSEVVLPMVAGFCLCLLPLIVYFERRHALYVLYWTTFVCPRLALAQIPRAPYRRLMNDSIWFATPWLPGLPLMALAMWPAARRRVHPHVWLLAGWSVAAFAAIVLQRFTWWRYYFVLLIPPCGLLTLCGIDAALDFMQLKPVWERLAAILMTVPLAATMALPVGPKLAAARAALRTGSFGDTYRGLLVPAYPRVLRSARLITSQHGPGDVFVFGDQRLLPLVGRRQAIPIRGAAPRSLLQQHWDAFPMLLASARPRFIYLHALDVPYMLQRSPGVIDLIHSAYHVLAVDELGGTWYERNPDNPSVPR